MTGGHSPGAAPQREPAPRSDQAAHASTTMREAWVQWAVAMLEEE